MKATNNKKRISLLLAAAMLISIFAGIFATTSKPTFTDVPTSHWAYDAIEDMADRGVVAGVGDSKFGPNAFVTTAQFSVMLARLFYNDEMSEMPANEAWFRNAITLLASKGVLDNTTAAIKDYDANSVSVPMTRYDMAQTMYGLLKAEGVTMPSADELLATTQQIADFNTIPAQYTDAVKNMYYLGCLAGVDAAGNFKGEDTMNRAQACVVLARLDKTIADREAGEVPVKPSDPDEQEPPTETTDPGTTSTELGQKLPSGATAAAGVASGIGKKDDYPTYGNSDVVSNNGYYTGATDVDIGTATLQYGFLELVNEARAAEGHAPLSWVSSDAAEEHTLQRCYELVSNFSHDRPQGKFANEVIAEGYYSVYSAFNGWMGSAGHKRALMKDNYSYMSAAKAVGGGHSYWIICLWNGDFELVERWASNNYDYSAYNN